MDLTTLLIIGLLVAGVVGSIVPMLPGALFSLVGIVVYYFYTSDPGLFFTAFLGLTAVFALATDWFAGSIAAKYGGASNKTSLMAGIAGVLGFIFLGGPIGLAVAVAATVLVREYMIHGKSEKGLKAAFYATIGVLGSAVIQTFLTAAILVAYLVALLV